VATLLWSFSPAREAVELTSMARRVPFPLSSIHANIEYSMTLLCDWGKEENEESKRWECVVKGSCEPEERRNSVNKESRKSLRLRVHTERFAYIERCCRSILGGERMMKEIIST
jgi:hypothetical protein